MKIGIGIQAHSFSKRFPNKIYETINGVSMLEMLYKTCTKVNLLNKVIDIDVRVLGHQKDEKLREFCTSNDLMGYFPETEDDNVVHRYAEFLKEFDLGGMIRVTSDCPLLPGEILERVILSLCEADYVTNTSPRTFLDGFDCQGISKKAFEYYVANTIDREHIFYEIENNNFLYEHMVEKKFKIRSILHPALKILNPYHPGNKLSVDTQEDLERIREIYAKHTTKQG